MGAAPAAQLDAAKHHVASYAHPDPFAAYCTLALTLGIHIATFLAWPAAYSGGLCWILAWSVVHGMNLTRAFVLAHDCAHGSTFRTSLENVAIGSLVGALVLMPFGTWRRRHLERHTTFGIEEEHNGDHGRTVFWTTREWQQWPLWRKALMRIVRDPFVFFSIGATVIFVGLGGGMPKEAASAAERNAPKSTPKPQQHTPGLRFALACLIIQLGSYRWALADDSSWLTLLLMFGVLIVPLASGMGLALYHLQHHVNTAYRVPRQHHSRDLAAYLGSTCLVVPWWAKWFTLGIEYHHLHHLSTQIPCYKLQACHDEAAAGTWAGVTAVEPALALRSLFNVMWDEDTQLYVSFAEYEALFAWLEQLQLKWPY